MTPTLKPPGSTSLKLKYDEPLLNCASHFNVRRYSPGRHGAAEVPRVTASGGGGAGPRARRRIPPPIPPSQGRAVQVDPMKHTWKAPVS